MATKENLVMEQLNGLHKKLTYSYGVFEYNDEKYAILHINGEEVKLIKDSFISVDEASAWFEKNVKNKIVLECDVEFDDVDEAESWFAQNDENVEYSIALHETVLEG